MHCARNTLALHSTPVGPSPVGRGVKCEVTPIGLPIRGVGRFISHAWEVLFSCLGGLSLTLGRFISHRSHRFNRTSLRTVSNSQKASGIQISQSVSAIVDAEQGATRSLHPAHRGISVITPPFGGGEGGGATTCFECCVFCSSVFFCEK